MKEVVEMPKSATTAELQESLIFLSPVETARELLKQKKAMGKNKYTIPVNVCEICRDNGIEVRYINMEEVNQEVGRKVCGVIKRISEEKYMFFLNEKYTESQKRFAIAHELGYYFLYKETIGDDVIASFVSSKNKRDILADIFAEELLMPEECLRKEYKEMIIPVSTSLAEKFQVPVEKMEERLDSLGLTYA